MKVDNNLGNNSLIRLLKTFSDEEWKEFEKFVLSPFFNKGRSYINFVKILKTFSPGFDSVKMTRQFIYSKLFPGKSYKESVMKSMISRLDDIAEDFLFQKAINNNSIFLRERFLLNEISKRGLRTRAEKIIKDTDKFIAGKKFGILDFISLKDYTNEVTNHYYNFNERGIYAGYLFRYQLLNIYSFLTEFLITEGTITMQKNFWPKDQDYKNILKLFESFDFRKIINGIEKVDRDKHKILKMFYLLMLASQNLPEDKYYFELKKIFFENINDFDIEFKKYFFNALTVICSTKTVTGKEEFRNEAFRLRKKIYEEGLNVFSEKDYLKNSEFRTAFLEAMSLNEKKWAVGFSEKYIGKLQPEFRDDMKNYCNAIFKYHERKFDKSLSFANKVNINQITFKLDIRNLISKIYYETDSSENLISLLNAYYQLIVNSKSQNRDFLERHLNFVKALRQLLNSKLSEKDEIRLIMLRDFISKENITSKKWLQNKVNELIRNK